MSTYNLKTKLWKFWYGGDTWKSTKGTSRHQHALKSKCLKWILVWYKQGAPLDVSFSAKPPSTACCLVTNNKLRCATGTALSSRAPLLLLFHPGFSRSSRGDFASLKNYIYVWLVQEMIDPCSWRYDSICLVKCSGITFTTDNKWGIRYSKKIYYILYKQEKS